MGLLDTLGLRPLAGQAKALTPPPAGGDDVAPMPAPLPGAADDARPAPNGAPDAARLRGEIDADLASITTWCSAASSTTPRGGPSTTSSPG